MKFTNAIKIATANKWLCLKTLIYKSVVIIATIVSLFLFANIVIEPILKSQEVANVINATRNVIKNFILMNQGEEIELGVVLKTSINSLLINVKNMTTEIVLVVIAMFLVIAFAVFLLSLGDYSIGVNVYEHTSSMLHAGFFSTLFENFKKASIYALYKTLFLMVYYTLGIALILFVIISTAKFLGLYVVTLALLLFFIENSLCLTLSGLVLPKMICEKVSPIKAFKTSFKKGECQLFFSRLISYFLMTITMYVVGVVSVVSTFFVALLIIIPLSSIAYIALKFVDYYSIIKVKYYITYDEIVVPKELRTNDEHLLNKVDID
ncbi:MAG: hypothetical protein J6R29_01690 [Clostridia bacterium]|nr:hypothetical protein [Clostridia bacterium]